MSKTRTYTIGDKLRLLALRLDQRDHPNPFVRAWQAFWRKPQKDDTIQQDLRVWAAVLAAHCPAELDSLASPAVEAQLEAIRRADKSRTYNTATRELAQ